MQFALKSYACCQNRKNEQRSSIWNHKYDFTPLSSITTLLHWFVNALQWPIFLLIQWTVCLKSRTRNAFTSHFVHKPGSKRRDLARAKLIVRFVIWYPFIHNFDSIIKPRVIFKNSFSSNSINEVLLKSFLCLHRWRWYYVKIDFTSRPAYWSRCQPLCA